jgi:hypothetical protein
MHMARKSILIVLVFFTSFCAYAQNFCATSTTLVCLLPFSTNAGQGQTNPSPQSIAALQKAASFNGPIAAQLSQLPAATSAPIATTVVIKGDEVPFGNLGPVLLDRPDSVGTGTLVLGFSFQHFDFNHLDGIPDGSLPFVFQQAGSGQFPTQYLAQTEQVTLHLNQYIALATVGLPHKTDFSIIVPFAQVSIGATSLAPTNYLINTDNTLGGFSTGANGNPVTGSSSGIGDITFNVKHVLWSGGESRKGSLATGVALRLPTGDAFNYLGSGAYGFNLYALVSYKYWISPHAKFAYQFNTNTVLLNLDNTAGGNRPLPGGSQFALGADVNVPKLHDKLTGSVDVLANEFVNSPYIQQTNTCIPVSSALPCSTVTAAPNQKILPDVALATRTYTSANMSFGLKVKPVRGLIVFGNVLIQVNDVGLRADPSPSFGISYSFPSLLTGKHLHKALDR